jgi:hypothetical protein
MKTEVIKIEVNTAEAKKGFEDINSVIKEQKQITIEFKKELLELERQLRNTPKNALAAQKQLKDRIVGLKDAIKDQNLSLQELNVTKSNQSANKIATAGADKLNKSLDANRGFLSALNSLTGGLSNQILGVGKQFKNAVTAVKSFNIGLSGMKKALIATGIGALVVALGTIVAYWDDIKEAISGTSTEQKNLLQTQQDSVAATKESLDNISGSENILKKQGKTEREILLIKQKATDEAIAALEAQLETQKQLKKSQVETQTANKAILKGMLEFVTAPLALLLKGIDAAGAAFGKDFGLAEGLYDSVAGLLFDPAETEKKANEDIKATESALLKLKNSRAGYQLAVEGIDNDAAEKAKAKKAKEDKQKEADELKAADALAKLKKDIREAEANTEAELRAKELEDLKLHYDNLIIAAEEANLETNELKASQQEALLALQADFDAKDLAATRKLAEEKQKLKDDEEAQAKAVADAEAAIRDANLTNAQDGFALLGQLAGKNRSLQAAALIGESAAGIAKIVLNTQAANARGLVELGPILGAANAVKNNISAGIGIATSTVATAKALSALKAGGSAPSASVGSIRSSAAPAPAAPSFNIVGQGGTNQLAETIAGQDKQPIKAYVVSGDVTTAQSMERNIVESASI